MAQIKTPYGLVYNTDGRLCTTYRDDDVPFAGVRSFAVEEATTNLFDNFDLTTWSKNSNMTSEYYRLTGEKYLGCPVAEFGKPGEDRSFTGIVDRYIYKTFSELTEGDVYTFSVYVYVLEAGYPGVPTTYVNSIELRHTTEVPTIWFSDLPVGKWVRVELTGTVDAEGQIQPRVDVDNSYIRLACPQLEKKSFATSFVDGSRPGGRILFEDMQELEYDNFVFTCWANYRSVVPVWQFVTTIFTPDNNLANEANHYSIRRRYDGVVYLQINSYDLGTATIGHTELTEGWHFFLIAVHDGYTDFWIDDAKYTNRKYVVSSKDKNIYLGTWWFGTYPWQNTIANVFVGKYRKPNGTVIWTDDYIREVYEAKIPFPAQSKLSIY
jgi:hypothetical protein